MTGAYRKTWPDRDALTFTLSGLRQFAARPRDRRQQCQGRWLRLRPRLESSGR
jgi:hypothetical protein